MIDNLTPYIKMTPPVMKVAPPKMKMTHRSYCHLRFILLYQIRELDFENLTLSRRKNFNHVADNGCGCEELTTALTFGQCKFTQEVFVYLVEDVKLYIRRNILKVLQELCQYERIILTVNAVINVLRKQWCISQPLP